MLHVANKAKRGGDGKIVVEGLQIPTRPYPKA
jgi:hypothetical protein